MESQYSNVAFSQNLESNKKHNILNLGNQIKSFFISALATKRIQSCDINTEYDSNVSEFYTMGLKPAGNALCASFHESYTVKDLMSYSNPFQLSPQDRDVLPDLVQSKISQPSPTPLQLQVFGNNPEYTLCNIFWRPALAFHPYKHGDCFVPFESLWPEGDYLHAVISEFANSSVSLRIIIDLCLFTLRCGPIRILKKLIECQLININHIFENTYGMLHICCIAQNHEAVNYLISSGISCRIQDGKGRLAEHVCYNYRCLKTLNTKNATSPVKVKSHKPPSNLLKEKIFMLAKSIDQFEELLIMLQFYIFDVNKEYDVNGDNLLHIAVRGGLSLLALTITLIKNYKANVEAVNSKGETPLIIAINQGSAVLVEILICVFGSEPNIYNPLDGWTPLHYAAQKNHMDIVSCLIKRGADTNMENLDGFWPDDLVCSHSSTDCKTIILSARQARSSKLQLLVEHSALESSELRKSDLFVVDEDGATLIMTAAVMNKCKNLELLLEIEGCPINAQHEQTGQTALSMAAAVGHVDTVKLLLRFDADPSIKDMEGMIPLHHAIIRNHQTVVEVLLQKSSCWIGLSPAIQMSKSVTVVEYLHEALQKRQKYIVAPLLFECCITSNPDKLYSCLEEGDDLNPLSGVGDWPMYLAVTNGHLDVVKLLYERGGDIWSHHIATHNTVLHMACNQGHTSIVQFLLENALNHKSPVIQILDLNAINNHGKTAIGLAADKGYSQIVKMLLIHGASSGFLDANGNLYNCQEYQGVQVLIETHRRMRTDLMMSCIRDRRGIKKLRDLWMERFDHNLRDRKGNTPLMVACRYAKLEIVYFLLESAIQIHQPNKYQNCRFTYDDRFSEQDAESSVLTETVSSKPSFPYNLHINSCEQKHIVGRPDLERSGDDHLSSCHTQNLLSESTQQMDKKVLVQARAYSDHNRTDFEDSWRWARGKNVHWKNTLVESYDHDKNPLSIFEISGFFNNLGQGNNSIFTKDNMISHVCAVNPLDGTTVLHHAVERGNIDVVEMILEKDQNCVNMQDNQGQSALHIACKLGHRKIVTKLLSLPYIDPNLRTLDGKLPEEMSVKKSIIKCFQIIRGQESSGLFSSFLSRPTSIAPGSSVDFEKINARFTLLQQGIESESPLEESYSS